MELGWHHSGVVCVCGGRGGGGGVRRRRRGVLWYSGIFEQHRLGAYLFFFIWFKISNFTIFGGFSEKMTIFWVCGDF